MYMNVSPQILNNNNNNNNNIILKHFSPKHNEHILFYFLNKYRMTNGHCIYNCQYVHNVTCQFRYKCLYIYIYIYICRSQWARGLRCGSTAARFLGLWVRIPPGAWMSVLCECCVCSSRGLCDGLITRPEKSYRL